MANQPRYLKLLEELNGIANDETKPVLERIRALAELYFLYQFDVHNQSKTVRRIQDLAK
jgi:hypothetical protein